MTKVAKLKALNKREPKPLLIARLMTEACGESCKVSLVDSLEFRRDQYGLTARDFAMAIGMSQQHYSEVVNGKRDIPIKAAKERLPLACPHLHFCHHQHYGVKYDTAKRL